MMSPEIARGRARRAQITAAIALVVAALGILLSVILFARLAKTTDRLARTDAALQRSRLAVTHHVCDALGTLIVRGAVSSKPFESLYRQFGAPPYKIRVNAARKDARTLCLRIKRETSDAGL